MTAALAHKSNASPPSGDTRGAPVRLHTGDVSFGRTAATTVRRIKPSVRLAVFGGIGLHVGDREITLSSHKAKALIAYLALAPGMKETRDRLVGLLWSEFDDTKARASLRQLVYALRGTFDNEGLAGLAADKLHVSLDPSIFTTDLDYAFASVDRGDPLDCLVNETRISETILSGHDDVDPSFACWLRTKRECVRQRLIRGLEAQLLGAKSSIHQTKRVARALFQVDPTNETACQELMRTHVESGDIAGALAAYKQLWEHLEEDYDMEPSAATQDLVVAIKNGTFAPPASDLDLRSASAIAFPGEEPQFDVLLAVKLAIACMAVLEASKRKT